MASVSTTIDNVAPDILDIYSSPVRNSPSDCESSIFESAKLAQVTSESTQNEISYFLDILENQIVCYRNFLRKDSDCLLNINSRYKTFLSHLNNAKMIAQEKSYLALVGKSAVISDKLHELKLMKLSNSSQNSSVQSNHDLMSSSENITFRPSTKPVASIQSDELSLHGCCQVTTEESTLEKLI